MQTRTINIPVTVPNSYPVDELKRRLTDYAQYIISQPVINQNHYKHESLCGIFKSKQTEDDLVEEYLKDKYELQDDAMVQMFHTKDNYQFAGL